MKIRLCAFADEAGSSAEEQIKALTDNGIALIEVRNVDGKNISKMTEDEARGFAAKLKKAGIGVWSLGSPLAKVSVFTPLKKEMKRAEHLCVLAKIFETENIRAFSFFNGGTLLFAGRAVRMVTALAAKLKENGVNYCHENDTGFLGAKVKGLDRIIAALPELKLIYDPANFLVSGQNPEVTLNKYADKAFYFHIKDAIGKKIVPAGAGNGRLPELIARLDRDTVFTVEPHLLLFRGCDGFDSSAYDLNSKRGRFDCAVGAIKKLLLEAGFEEKDGYFEKN